MSHMYALDPFLNQIFFLPSDICDICIVYNAEHAKPR